VPQNKPNFECLEKDVEMPLKNSYFEETPRINSTAVAGIDNQTRLFRQQAGSLP